MKKLTAQMVHEAYCTATPAAWNKPWPQISQAEEARYQVMADYLNGQFAPQEQERHFCAMLDCDQPVAEDGALCEACRACEELQPESAQPPEEPERATVGAAIHAVLVLLRYLMAKSGVTRVGPTAAILHMDGAVPPARPMN